MRLGWALSGLLFAACTPFSAMDQDLSKYDTPEGEVAFPGARVMAEGEVAIDTADGGTHVVPFVVQEGLAVAGGDILLGPADALLQRSAGIDRASRIWDTCEIAYSFDPSLTASSRQDFLDAVTHWESNTALTFVEDASAGSRLVVQDGSGCSSYVGKQGGAQTLTLNRWCGRGAAIHEIGHAMGLWHEQSRADADAHVQKHWENIPSANAHNFRTYEQRWQPGIDLGPYDPGSIMHYASGAFATGTCNWSDTSGCTITHLDGSYITEHQRIRLSDGDLAGIDALYGPHCGAAPEPPADDHGNTRDTATELRFDTHGTTELSAVLDAADRDIFRIEALVGGALSAFTEGSTDTHGTLFAADGTQLDLNDDTQGLQFAVTATVAPGTYFLHVRGYSDAVTGPYDLVVSLHPETPAE